MEDTGKPQYPDVPLAGAAIEAVEVWRRFDERIALRGVSMAIPAGEIHALLGPNGAGKTTLMRILAGHVDPSGGEVRVLGTDVSAHKRSLRAQVALVPSGQRSFYLRISGLENLVFFARMHGFARREALRRAHELLDHVGLRDAAKLPVGAYSHGMHRRLSVARALLTDPAVMLVDEATHDLDPEGSHTVRDLVTEIASRGAAVIWTTQRIEEIRGFAHRVTVLDHGRVRFRGSVPQLLAHALLRRYLLRLRLDDGLDRGVVGRAVGGMGAISPAGDGDLENYLLVLGDDVVLGDALAALTSAGVRVLACSEEQPEIEQAFMSLTRSEDAS